MSIIEQAKVAHELATALLKTPPCMDAPGSPEKPRPTCIERERTRKPTRAEQRAAGIRLDRLPFHRYNVRGMCTACRAYWYATNAAREIDTLAAEERAHTPITGTHPPASGLKMAERKYLEAAGMLPATSTR